MRITVSHDLSRIAQSLNRLSGRLNGSLEEPLRAIGGALESSTRRRIAETKTAPDGKRWQDVSPATAEAKNGRGGILVDHGNLLASITHEASATQKIGVSDGLFSRNLFGIILGSLGIIIVGLVAKKPHCSGALC